MTSCHFVAVSLSWKYRVTLSVAVLMVKDCMVKVSYLPLVMAFRIDAFKRRHFLELICDRAVLPVRFHVLAGSVSSPL